MKVITAPEEYEMQEQEISCFLAGGITGCPDWQKEVIELLEFLNPVRLIVFNPRRENFPVDDHNASNEQISWEFKYLNQADIFSMYFCAGESDQPICMYELGRHLFRINEKYESSEIPDHIVIGVEEGYKRKTDVIIQTSLAIANNSHPIINSNSKVYVDPILRACVTTDTDPYIHAEQILMSYMFQQYGDSPRFKDKLREYKSLIREFLSVK